ncbi:MAG: DUF4160 domain-containing protein, partial [Selenomonadaceae bacterium]|nr:DUF4160 domain-containing protein [Selenomonadaceae bacterium]
MPQIFKIGKYTIYFWSNEGNPLESVHVHISEGRQTPYATKIWITSNGKCLLCNNNSNIPNRILRNIEDTIEARIDDIIDAWQKFFGEF